MPSRRRLSLSPSADDDLADILQYTEARWGAEQADTYQSTLQQALLQLVDFPHIGKERPDLPAGYRSLVVDQHAIYYRLLDDKTICVSRVVHTRRDIRADMLE